MSTVQVDAINESTTNAGVTVDGVLIKDGTVDGVDVSGLNSAGLVLVDSHSFSAATSVTRDDVFTSSYKNYVWELTLDSTSATGYVNFQYRSSGTTYSTATYDWQNAYWYSSVTTTGIDNGQNDTKANIIYNDATNSSYYSANIINPALSFATMAVGVGIRDAASNTEVLQMKIAWRSGTTTAFDGFILTPASGNITGEVKVYGKA